MAIGTVILAIAMIDELVLEIARKRRPVVPTEALHNE